MLSKKGFFLVELLLVVVIIGILIALILPNALRAIKQANTKECASNLRTIDTAIQMYYTETRAWPADMAALAPYFPDDDGDGTTDTPVCPFGVAYSIAGAGTDAAKGDRSGHFSAGNWPDVHD